MDDAISVRVVTPKPDDVRLPCHVCGKITYHKVLTEVDTSSDYEEHGIAVWEDYLVVQCQGCREVSFCKHSKNTEDLTFDPKTGNEVLNTTTQQFPGRIAGRPLMDHCFKLPHGVYQVYSETHAALCGNLAILSGIGIRAIVEAVCNERKSPGSDLYKQINGLVGMGLTTPEGGKILQSLRFMGNQAAHEVKAHTREELGVAFDVVEHLMKGVYIIPKLAAKLPPP